MNLIDKDALINILNAKGDMALGTVKQVFYSVAKMVEKLPTIEAPLLKLGDTVYYYQDSFNRILPYFVEEVNVAYFDENTNVISFIANCNIEGELYDSIDFDPSDIGETVFLTEEDAEGGANNEHK